MGYNDSITGKNGSGLSQYTMQQEAEIYSKLTRMKDALNQQNYDLELMRLNKLHQQAVRQAEQEANLLEKYAIRFADFKYKLEKKTQDKIDKLRGASAAAEEKKLKKRLDDQLKAEKKKIDALIKYEQEKQKQQEQAELTAIAKQRIADRKEAGETFFNGKASLGTRFSALKQLGQAQGVGAVFDALIGGLGNLVRQLDNQIDTIAGYQSKLDTRLMGSGKRWESWGFWDKNSISNTITGVVGVSPLIKQQKVTENLASLVDQGIAYNVEQRAFLQTISEKIATTFDAANGTLLQLIRVQQKDTTAARLGMEATLNQFFNKTFQNTEYLNGLSDTVTSNIYEAIALAGGERGVSLEYQIQKWLGSLYSVGMSQTAIQNISSALGMLGSGNVSGLASNSAMQNLLVMAASQSGGKFDYADLLTKGLDESNINILMQSMVNYLAQIANSNKVVQSQYAAVFGMSMSDIMAVKNLVSNQDALETISQRGLTYSNAINNLLIDANSMYERTSTGELIQTAFENMKYSMAAGVATNPVLYGIWKASNMLTDLVGGIAIPTISVMGNMVDLNTTVADIMRVGALSGGILSSIGSMIAAGSGGGFTGTGMLSALGITRNATEADKLSFYNELTEDEIANLAGKASLRNKLTTIKRGTQQTQSGASVSQSTTMVGNTDSNSVYEQSIASADEQKESLSVKNPDEVDLNTIHGDINAIYNMFRDIIDNQGMKVQVSYGIDNLAGANPATL